MKHRVALAREQGVDADAAFCRQLFEAAPLQFVSDEYFTLLVGQFVERKFQFIKKHIAEVERFRPGIGDGKRSSIRSTSPSSSTTAASLKVSGFFLRKRSVMRLRATRKSQPVTCSIGISRRLTSTSS